MNARHFPEERVPGVKVEKYCILMESRSRGVYKVPRVRRYREKCRLSFGYMHSCTSTPVHPSGHRYSNLPRIPHLCLISQTKPDCFPNIILNMRQKRAKAYKKQMNIYVHTFKFREPFQTIVDDELLLQCHKAQFDIVKGLDRTIQAETKPMITQCCMQALYLTENQPAIELAKTFERRRCNHNIKDPKTPVECIQSIVDVNGENKHRYIVASQSMKLRRKLRSVPGVPLVFMNRSVMVMEPTSDASKRAAALSENAKLAAGLNDKKVGLVEKDKDLLSNLEEPVRKKRKGPSEPNPLSIRKKKSSVKPNEPSQNETQKKKRVRHHKSRSQGEEGSETAKNDDNDNNGHSTDVNDNNSNDSDSKGSHNGIEASDTREESSDN